MLFGFVGVCAVLAVVTVYQMSVPAAARVANKHPEPAPRDGRASSQAGRALGARVRADTSRPHPVERQQPAKQHSAQRNSVAPRPTAPHAAAPHSAAPHSAAPHSATQSLTAQYSAEESATGQPPAAPVAISTPVHWADENVASRTPLERAIADVCAYPDSRAALDAALAVARQQPSAAELLELYATGVERFPHDLDLRFDYGVELMKRRLWSQAVTQLRGVAAEAPERPHVWHNLAAAEQAAGHLDDAERSWTRAIELAPENLDARAYRGQVRLDLHEWAAALADFEHVLADEPAALDAQLGAATALLHVERTADSLARLEQAVALAPGDVTVLNQAARIAMDGCLLGGSSSRDACEAAARYAGQSLALDASQPEIESLRDDARLASE